MGGGHRTVPCAKQCDRRARSTRIIFAHEELLRRAFVIILLLPAAPLLLALFAASRWLP